jgi:prepilin-type N-terminal cleavage/methylation domain-containing protein
MVMRAGFSLAEVIVALALLAVAVLSVSGAAATGTRWLAEAEAEAGAALRGAALLDSIVASPRTGSGQDSTGRYRADWQVTDSAGRLMVVLHVRYANGTATGQLTLHARALAVLPLVPRVQ